MCLADRASVALEAVVCDFGDTENLFCSPNLLDAEKFLVQQCRLVSCCQTFTVSVAQLLGLDIQKFAWQRQAGRCLLRASFAS